MSLSLIPGHLRLSLSNEVTKRVVFLFSDDRSYVNDHIITRDDSYLYIYGVL